MNSLELKLARIRRGKRIKDMANQLGLTDTSWRLKEGGKVAFSIKQAVEASKVLELNAEQFNIIFLDGRLPSGNQNRAD